MTVKLTKIVLSIVAGLFGLVLVMGMLAGAGPAAARKDVGEGGGVALVVALPQVVEVDASPTEIRADGYSDSTITGTVKDSDGSPVSGAFVAFTTTLGAIDPYCYVEAEDASVIKSSGWYTEGYSGASGGQYVRTCGTAHPGASLNWTFTASAISMLYVKDHNGGVAEVQVDGSTVITVDMYASTKTAAEKVIATGLGSGSHIITVKYLDQSPVGGGTCIRVDAFRCGATTDANGQATAALTSIDLSCGSEDATVTAIVGAPSMAPTITNTTSVTMTASVPDNVTVTASPNEIEVGGETSTLEATVGDQFGEYVPDCTMVGFVATDENGAPSDGAWVTLPHELVEGEDPTEVITDSWSIDTNGHHGGEAIYSNTSGATASWDFTGTAVSLIYPKLSDAGVATVTVDSGSPITVDMYASSGQYQVEHVITDALSYGSHVIEVTVAGHTVTGGTDTRVYVDAFRSGTCTSDGTGTAIATSGTQAGVTWVEATAVGRQCCETDSVVMGTVPITLKAGDPYTLTITPAAVSITCCVTSTLQFTVTDQYSNVVGAVVPMTLTVGFDSTPYGIFTPTTSVVITDGVGSVIFHGWTAGSGTITGTVNGIVGTAALTVAPASCDSLDISADRSWIYVTDTHTSSLDDFVYTTTITAELEDSCDNSVQDGTAVTFTTSLGSLSTTTPTTTNGLATAVLTSEQISGLPTKTAYITVTGASCPASDITSVDFVRHVYTLTITADSDEIRVGGNTSDLTANVRNGFGGSTPDGVPVTFTIAPALATVSPVNVETEGGTATVTATSGTQAEVATIEVTATGSTITKTGLITITAGDPYTLTMTPTDINITCCVTSTLQFTVTDEYSNVVGAVVPRPVTVNFFSTRQGDFLPSDSVVVTDGVGSVVFHGSEAGTGNIEGRVEGIYPQGTDTSNLTVSVGSPAALTVSREPTAILADGLDTTIITATVRDSCDNFVAGSIVTFTTDLGSFGPPPTTTLSITSPTNSSGVATATMRSECTARTVNITVTVDSVTEPTYVDMVGVAWDVQLAANPTSIQVGGYTSNLTATVNDQFGHSVLDGTVVTFTTSSGSVGSDTTTKTTTGGVATAVLTSPNTSGTAVITATAGSGADAATDTVTVTLEPGPPYTVTLEANPTSILVGGFTSTLTATVTDQYDNNVADDTEVLFETSLGSLGSVTVTKLTANGVATATLTSGETTGTAMITATADSKVATTPVTFTPDVPYTVTLVADPTSLVVGETSTLTATVTDQYDNHVADGTEVGFTTGLGILGSTTVTKTTSDGVATAVLTSETEAGTAIVTATSGSEIATTPVTFIPDVPYSITLIAYPTSLTVDDSSTLTATVKDQYDNHVADGTVVTFETNLGSLGSVTITKSTADGVAGASLTSQVPGTATITATADAKVATTTVEFDPGSPYTVTLAAYPISLTVGGTSALTATVTDQYDNHVADGTAVDFETSLGSLGSITASKTTINGVATATLTSQIAGTAVVTAASDSRYGTANVIFNPGSPHTVTVGADPTSIPIGGSTSTIAATVEDQYSNPVADGTEATFTTDLGSLGSSSVVTTTLNGVATATLISELTIGTANVTVTVDSLDAHTQVTFTVGPPDDVVAESSPSTIEVGGSTATITATVRDVGGYLVADDTPVEFTTDFGSLGSSTVTKYTTNGEAVAILTSPETPGVVHVTATADSVSDTATVKIAAGPPSSIVITADPSYIPVGGATSSITATVQDRYGNNVTNGTPVDFTTSLGSVSPPLTTTIEGMAGTTLTSGNTKGTATVTGQSGSASGSVDVSFTVGPPAFVGVVADPTSIGLGGQTSNIQATVEDIGGNAVADGTVVTFTTSLGSLGSTTVLKTTAGGVAEATLTSETIAGTAVITATADSKYDITEVVINPNPPYTVTLKADPTAIPASGVSTSTLRAAVKDQYGNDVADGITVYFDTTLGSVSPLFANTVDGVAETTLTSSETDGLSTVTATCEGIEDTSQVFFYSYSFQIYLPVVFKSD